jgi:hypothetical protein
MRKILIHFSSIYFRMLLLFVFAITSGSDLIAQDSTTAEVVVPVVKKKSYTKNTFEGNYLIDNQTVMVPIKGTFEFDINHRFGTIKNGFSDLFGLFAGANMRLGFYYTPLKNLQIGFGANNLNMQVDWSLKYALLKQTKDGKTPVSVTYYGNAAMDTRERNPSLAIVTTSDRFTFFNEIMLARKMNDKFSVQAGISLTHFNSVDGYYDDKGNIQPAMKNDNLAISLSGRYKISPKTSVMVNYDQPLTQHPMNNPHPNISFGLDMKSSGHDFQVFFGNYGFTLPQSNSMLNQNDYTKGQFLIGFNISRLWNF